jgi:hypothetical protein
VLSVTANDKDGKEVFKADRIFMPVPQRLGRGDQMGRGPYEKSGMLQDSSLPPLRTVTSNWDVFFPVVEEEKDGETVRTYPSDSLEIDVKLWYLPYGTMEDDAVLWREQKSTVKLAAVP